MRTERGIQLPTLDSLLGECVPFYGPCNSHVPLFFGMSSLEEVTEVTFTDHNY